MGAVAALATSADLAVRGGGLGLVAALARRLLSPGVGLVAIRAVLVARWGGGVLGLMASPARLGLRAVVRLMATGALGVSHQHGRALGCVATVTAGLRQQRPVGEAAVARFASLVAVRVSGA